MPRYGLTLSASDVKGGISEALPDVQGAMSVHPRIRRRLSRFDRMMGYVRAAATGNVLGGIVGTVYGIPTLARNFRLQDFRQNPASALASLPWGEVAENAFLGSIVGTAAGPALYEAGRRLAPVLRKKDKGLREHAASFLVPATLTGAIHREQRVPFLRGVAQASAIGAASGAGIGAAYAAMTGKNVARNAALGAALGAIKVPALYILGRSATREAKLPNGKIVKLGASASQAARIAHNVIPLPDKIYHYYHFLHDPDKLDGQWPRRKDQRKKKNGREV